MNHLNFEVIAPGVILTDKKNVSLVEAYRHFKKIRDAIESVYGDKVSDAIRGDSIDETKILDEEELLRKKKENTMITDKDIEDMAEGIAEALNSLATKAPDAPGSEGDIGCLTLFGEHIVQVKEEHYPTRTIIRTKDNEYSIPDEGEQLLKFLRKHQEEKGKFPSIYLEGKISARKLDRVQFNVLSDEQEADFKTEKTPDDPFHGHTWASKIQKQFKPCDCTPLDPRCDCGKYYNYACSARVNVDWLSFHSNYRIKWRYPSDPSGEWRSMVVCALSEHAAVESIRTWVAEENLRNIQQGKDIQIIIDTITKDVPPQEEDKSDIPTGWFEEVTAYPKWRARREWETYLALNPLSKHRITWQYNGHDNKIRVTDVLARNLYHAQQEFFNTVSELVVEDIEIITIDTFKG
jgi:hypothetical protein